MIILYLLGLACAAVIVIGLALLAVAAAAVLLFFAAIGDLLVRLAERRD